MRILFFVHTLGRTRHFKPVLSRLVERGHTVILAPHRSEHEPLKHGDYDHPLISVAPCPMDRDDDWEAIADPLRRLRDRIRYLDERYANSAKLADRAVLHTPKRWNQALDRHSWLRRYPGLVQRALAVCEAAIPCPPVFMSFIREQAPDLILVTPLVDFGSYQTDYVKCAHRLGIPVVYLPFSWDNLTNRGLIRVAPDRTLVWSERQRAEAIELHGLEPGRIDIVGAPRFDQFFTRKPSTSREEFCESLGLDPSRRLLLYLCSSAFIAPEEVAFVRRWISALRAAPGGSWVRDCGILVRPHPANNDQWASADLTDLPQVALWTRRSSMNSDRGLFDSLYHATAAVGLNTSAMIEAAIVGRPVFTIAEPEFAGGQTGTLHFWYLLVENGGVVVKSEGFDQHVAQLTQAPQHEAETMARSQRFLNHFVRPHGLDAPVAPVMVDAIERAAGVPKRRSRSAPWHYAVRWALFAGLADHDNIRRQED
jgi:hypothetical protein